MNIAFVSNVTYPFIKGGAEKRIYEIGRRLAAGDHEVTVYSRRFWNGPGEIDFEGMTYHGVAPARELYTDSDGRRSISEAISFAGKVFTPLAKTVRGGDHDLIVASVFPYFPVVSSKGATLFGNVPLVTTWHEVWDDYWESYLGRLAPFGKSVERFVAAIPQYPVAVSNQTADQLAAIGPSRDTIRVIPNGISIEEIQSIPATSDGFDVLFAGRLIADKNVDMLLAAFDEVADRHGATLGIVGNGPQFDALVRQATQLRHSEKVSFLGFLDEYEDVLAHMHAADVFASPSTREGFGITLIEAMAANCTVIGVEHEGSAVSEVIGEGGFVTEFSVEALADALDDALAGRRPPHDPQTVVAQYDWEVVAQRAERVYADVLEKSVHADTEGCLNVSP